MTTRFRSESGAMRLARRLGFERLAWSLRRLHCPVPDDALVLEVGSGGNPYARANVLLDAYESTRERHWVPLEVDRPTVLGFVENLPFRDKVFDFVIASHVLEHSSDPARFIGELQRVAKAGYIETPDAFMERVNPYRDHRLEVTLRDDRLLLRKKASWVVDADLVELYEHAAKGPITRELIPRRPFAFHMRFYWENEIPFSVSNPEQDASWPPVADSDSAHGSTAPRLRSAIVRTVRRALAQCGRNRTLDILPLLRCPACKSHDLEHRPDHLGCSTCQARFSQKGKLVSMVPA